MVSLKNAVHPSFLKPQRCESDRIKRFGLTRTLSTTDDAGNRSFQAVKNLQDEQRGQQNRIRSAIQRGANDGTMASDLSVERHLESDYAELGVVIKNYQT